MPNPEQQPEVSKTPTPVRSNSGTALAISFAVVAISAIAAGAFVFRECSPRHISRGITSRLAQAFQPQVNVNTGIYTTLSNIVNHSKLVVLLTQTYVHFA